MSGYNKSNMGGNYPRRGNSRHSVPYIRNKTAMRVLQGMCDSAANDNRTWNIFKRLHSFLSAKGVPVSVAGLTVFTIIVSTFSALS